MLSDSVINRLRGIVGEENLLLSEEERICYSYDATNQRFLPDAIFFARTAEDVSSLLKLANDECFPVTPRGAGTGFTGGSLPVKGGVVLSLENMNRILAVDAKNFTAMVEPGVVNVDLQIEAGRQGLFYPPDPSSLKFSTIGGNIAECAGGPRAVKYGVTRDYVLGLEVVLPDGTIIETGVRTAKGVVGYDLTRLMVGSEGTLGVVTRALLRLMRFPEGVKTMLAYFDTLSAGASVCSAIMESGITPSALEFIDTDSISCVTDNMSLGFNEGTQAILLIELDGDIHLIDGQVKVVEKICRENGVSSFRIASTKREVRDIWRVRRSISPSLARLKPRKLNEDVVVPISRIIDLVTGTRDISEDNDLIIACFGHAGDGNIHVNVMIDDNNEDEFVRGRKAVKEVFRLVLGLGGTISGEHGVGTAKKPYIGMELSDNAIEVMRRIKRVFDPNGILNPGKIF